MIFGGGIAIRELSISADSPGCICISVVICSEWIQNVFKRMLYADDLVFMSEKLRDSGRSVEN